MKHLICATLIGMLFMSCSGKQPKQENGKIDTAAVRKQTLMEELPPPSDIRQFRWFYSGFVKFVSLHADTLMNKMIHPEYGLNVIESQGALPHMTHVKDFAEFRTLRKKSFYDFDAKVLVCDPKDEELPKIDCNAKDLYSKSGCFTREVNNLKSSKVWEFCNLSKDQMDLVIRSVDTITRTVVVTENYTYYFSLIKGGWWLTFIDMRRPCQA
jgi:hypothetical protein